MTCGWGFPQAGNNGERCGCCSDLQGATARETDAARRFLLPACYGIHHIWGLSAHDPRAEGTTGLRLQLQTKGRAHTARPNATSLTRRPLTTAVSPWRSSDPKVDQCDGSPPARLQCGGLAVRQPAAPRRCRTGLRSSSDDGQQSRRRRHGRLLGSEQRQEGRHPGPLPPAAEGDRHRRSVAESVCSDLRCSIRSYSVSLVLLTALSQPATRHHAARQQDVHNNGQSAGPRVKHGLPACPLLIPLHRAQARVQALEGQVHALTARLKELEMERARNTAQLDLLTKCAAGAPVLYHVLPTRGSENGWHALP